MRLLSTTKQTFKSQRGYSIIELIGAAMIFLLITIVVIGALVSVMRSSNRTGAERRSQQEARYSVEEIGRQTRSSSIDYAFYAQAGGTQCAFGLNGDQNASRVLALIFTESDEANAPVTKRMVFFQSNNAVYRYENNIGTATPTCDQVFAAPETPAGPDGERKTRITAETVTVPTLNFYISPNQDPYDQNPCPTGSAESPCLIARNTHPRMTLLMTAQVTGSGTGVAQTTGTGVTTIQTTINSRVYQASELLGQPN